MRKTFTTRTLDNVKVNLLALPNSNYFKMEIVSHYGANIERVYEKITGKNVYGISHLIEHLSFKTSKDFTTQELMDISRNEGYNNAGTTYDYIDYFFETIAQNMDLAIKYCFNIAYNDLTKISEEEFATEKNVVLNEIRRYADDEQAMFCSNVAQVASGLHVEDNVIGIAETVATFTLADAIAVKELLLTCPHVTYNISHDSTKVTEAEIMDKVLEQKQRFQPKPCRTAFSHDMYRSLLKEPQNGSFILASDSEQAMNMFIIPLECDAFTGNIVMKYIDSFAEKTSLNEVIREKHGLTYGIETYVDTFAQKCFIHITCDVDKSAQEQFLSLFEESVSLSVDNFTKEGHAIFMKTIKLKTVLMYLDLKRYETLFSFDKIDRNVLAPYLDILHYDIDVGLGAMRKAISFKVLEKHLKTFKKKINNKAYTKVSSV